MTNDGLKLVTPKITPALDQNFRPASVANRAFRAEVEASGTSVPVRLGIEQVDGSVFRFDTKVFAEDHVSSAGNFRYLERFIKFLLWSRGGFRVYFDGPAHLHAKLQNHYNQNSTG